MALLFELIPSILVTVLYMLFMRFYISKSSISPDERFYMNPKQKPPAPYVYRWLPRLLFVKHHKMWRWSSRVSLLLCGPLLYLTLRAWGLEPHQALLGVWIFCGLQGIFYLNTLFLGLVDQLGMVFMLASAAATLNGQIVLGVVLSFVGGSCSERTPVFAALSSMSFWPLLGLISPILARYIIEPGAVPKPNNPSLFWWLKISVFEVGKRKNGPRIMDWRIMIAPWGVCAILLPIGCATAEPLLVVSAGASLLIGYAQMRIATDTQRLFQWAFVPVIAISVLVLPVWAYPLVIALHPFMHGPDDLF
jgi:hypothetical protein